MIHLKTTQYCKLYFNKREREVAQSCPTLRNPMDCSLPGSSIHGIFQARVLESGAIAFSDFNKKVMFQLDILAFVMALKRQGGRIFQKFYSNATLRK